MSEPHCDYVKMSKTIQQKKRFWRETATVLFKLPEGHNVNSF